MVTGNRRDFLPLAAGGLHAGLIVLLEGGLRIDAQWSRLEPPVEFVLATGDPDFLLSRVVEIWGRENSMFGTCRRDDASARHHVSPIRDQRLARHVVGGV